MADGPQLWSGASILVARHGGQIKCTCGPVADSVAGMSG